MFQAFANAHGARMRDGISQRRLPKEGLGSGNANSCEGSIGIVNDVEACSLRPRVVKIHDDSMGNFLLHVRIPYLNIAQAVVRIDSSSCW